MVATAKHRCYHAQRVQQGKPMEPIQTLILSFGVCIKITITDLMCNRLLWTGVILWCKSTEQRQTLFEQKLIQLVLLEDLKG